VSRTLSYRGLW